MARFIVAATTTGNSYSNDNVTGNGGADSTVNSSADNGNTCGGRERANLPRSSLMGRAARTAVISAPTLAGCSARSAASHALAPAGGAAFCTPEKRNMASGRTRLP